MQKLLPLIVAIAVIGVFSAPAEPKPAANLAPDEELPSRVLVALVIGDDVLNVALDTPRVVSIGDASFIRGVVCESDNPSVSRGLPVGKVFFIRVGNVTMMQDDSRSAE